ncbi:MAG: hypothetical protein KF746_12005 [Chitinophagaceae bacterium]|nr:hypothetical protein [Chitinophagaceae bacterium]
MLNQEKTGSDINSLEDIFNSHKVIFKTYTDVHVPKHLLKDMMKDLQDYYDRANNTRSEQQDVPG